MTMPAWMEALRDAATASSQVEVARRLNYSPAVVNQVLRGSYKGDLTAVQRAVEGALMGLSVECPVIGDLARNRCIEYQRRGFAATNPLRVTLSQACPTCSHRRGA